MFVAAKAALIATVMMASPAFAQRYVERGYERTHREVHELRVQQGGPSMQYGRQYDAISYGHRGLIAVNLSFGGGGRQQVRYQPVREMPRGGGCRVNVDTRMPPQVQAVEVPRAVEELCYRRARAEGFPPPQIFYNYY